MIILLIVAALTGVPIFIVLGGIGYLLFAQARQPLEVIANEAYSLLTSHSLPPSRCSPSPASCCPRARPGSGSSGFFKAIFAWFPGGLAIMAILVCTFFTTFTGASGVTILAVGGLLSYVLVKGRLQQAVQLRAADRGRAASGCSSRPACRSSSTA